MSGRERTDCSTDHQLPQWFGFVYAITQSVFIIIAAIIGFINVASADPHIWLRLSCTQKIKAWFKSIYNKRACYYPVITHMFDQVSDYMVTVEFYFLWQQEEKYGTQFCTGLDMKAIFFSSIFILLSYRVITSYFLFKYTKSIVKVLLQFIDLEFIQVISLNWKRNRTTPNSMQRWLQSFESTFEAAPQALLQFMFLLKTGQIGNPSSTSYIVLFSFLFSMISLTSRVTNDEKYLFVKHAQAANWTDKACCKFSLPNNKSYPKKDKPKLPNIKPLATDTKTIAIENEAFETEVKTRKGYFCFLSLPYTIRVMYRLMDVSSHMFIYSLLWLTMGAVSLILLLLLDFIIITTIIIKYKMNNMLLGMISTRLSRSGNINIQIACLYFNIYRFTIHLICLLCITFIGYINLNCSICSQDTLNTYFSNISGDGLTVFIVYIYSLVSFIISLTIYILFHRKLSIFVDTGVSTDRTIKTMMKSGDIDGIFDALSYGYYVENEQELIASTLYYVTPDKDTSWYSNIITDPRIDLHIEVLLNNPFLRESVINAINKSPKWRNNQLLKQNGIQFSLDSLLRGETYLRYMIKHMSKEFSIEMIGFIITIIRYRQYVKEKLPDSVFEVKTEE
eukprot:62477_1